MHLPSNAHRYVSPAAFNPASRFRSAQSWDAEGPATGTGSSRAAAAAAAQRRPFKRAASRLEHGGDHPAPALVPLVHVGHLSVCVCVSVHADTR